MLPLYVLSCAKMKKCVQTTHRTAIRNLSKKYLQISLRKDFSAECPHFYVIYHVYLSLAFPSYQNEMP